MADIGRSLVRSCYSLFMMSRTSPTFKSGGGGGGLREFLTLGKNPVLPGYNNPMYEVDGRRRDDNYLTCN